jgi:hypothetical protein
VHTNIASHSVDFEAVLTVGIYLVKITAEVLSKILRAHEGLQLELKKTFLIWCPQAVEDHKG